MHPTIDSLKPSHTCQVSIPRSTRVSVHVPANCQLPSITRLANQARFHMPNKVPVLVYLETSLKRQLSSFDVYFSQSHNTLLPKYSWIKLFADGYPSRKNCKSLVPQKYKRIQYILHDLSLKKSIRVGDVIVWCVEMPSPRGQSNSTTHAG